MDGLTVDRTHRLIETTVAHVIQTQENWGNFLVQESLPGLDRRERQILEFFKDYPPQDSEFAHSLWKETPVAKSNWYSCLEVRDAGGGLLWHLQTSLGAQVLAAAFTAGGDVVTGGRAPGGVDAAAPDAKGPWVARYGAGGSLVWRTMLGADYRGWVRSVAISASDDVYVRLCTNAASRSGRKDGGGGRVYI